MVLQYVLYFLFRDFGYVFLGTDNIFFNAIDFFKYIMRMDEGLKVMGGEGG